MDCNKRCPSILHTSRWTRPLLARYVPPLSSNSSCFILSSVSQVFLIWGWSYCYCCRFLRRGLCSHTGLSSIGSSWPLACNSVAFWQQLFDSLNGGLFVFLLLVRGSGNCRLGGGSPGFDGPMRGWPRLPPPFYFGPPFFFF